jgi:hypothetical protein
MNKSKGRASEESETSLAIRIAQQKLGNIPWLVAGGERIEVFRALGKKEASHIHALTENSEMVNNYRRKAAKPKASRHLLEVHKQSEKQYPEYWESLRAMAEGANVPFDDLVLLNHRGDIGTEDWGCTDVSFIDRDKAIFAHNEDGEAELQDHSFLLTLLLEKEPATTAFWFPGFLPSNTFGLNEYGVVWGIDAIRVAKPSDDPGRHFVSNGLQKCHTIAEVITYLSNHPSAGGFTYNVGQIGKDPSVAQIESAAGRHAIVTMKDPRSADLLWHTNHLRYLPSSLDLPPKGGSSMVRGEVASKWTIPVSQPINWCLNSLTKSAIPLGVHQEGKNGAITLATFIADLYSGRIIIAPLHGEPIEIQARDLARGKANHQKQYRVEQKLLAA